MERDEPKSPNPIFGVAGQAERLYGPARENSGRDRQEERETPLPGGSRPMPSDPSSPEHHDLTPPEVANDLGINVRLGEALPGLARVIAFRLGVAVPVAGCAMGLTEWGDTNPLNLFGLGIERHRVERVAKFVGCDPDRLRVGLHGSLEGGPVRLECPTDPSLGWLAALHRQPLSLTRRKLCSGCEADEGDDGMAGRYENVSGLHLATTCLHHGHLLESRCPRCSQPFSTINPKTVLTDMSVPTPTMCENRMGDDRLCGMDLREVPMLSVNEHDPAVDAATDYRLACYEHISYRIDQLPIVPAAGEKWTAAHATAALAALVAEPEDLLTSETWLRGAFEMHCRRRWLCCDDGPLQFQVPAEPAVATCVAPDAMAVLDAEPGDLAKVWSPLAERVGRRISDHPDAAQIETAFVKVLPETFVPTWRAARGLPQSGGPQREADQ